MSIADVFRRRIVEWYLMHGDSDLPWRKTEDPWAILVAAFLLRRTRVRQVAGVYEELLRRYPTPHALARARAEEVESLIRPLGMERVRSRQLVELAARLVEEFDGVVPCSREDLRRLPGVGDYTASEVLLASCGVPEPLLDSNAVRVLKRFFGLKPNKGRPYADPALRNLARALLPQDPEEAKALGYGIVDFARKVCTARRPRCSQCPLSEHCSHYSGSAHSWT